jgi:hypothetical protein
MLGILRIGLQTTFMTMIFFRLFVVFLVRVVEVEWRYAICIDLCAYVLGVGRSAD